jgi:hypothetical protein
MTTSSTWNFDPSLGEIIVQAFGRIGIRRTELLASHMNDGRMAANLVLSEWSNRQPNLWTAELISVPLTTGISTYACSSPVVQITDMYVNNTASDYILTSISRSEYAAIPNKTLQSQPTQFWFNRQIDPYITFWPVPNSTSYTANYWCVKQFEDADLANGLTVDLPYRFFDAFVAAIAWRLSDTYRPELSSKMAQEAERAWQIAATQDVENVPLHIAPAMAGYWDR